MAIGFHRQGKLFLCKNNFPPEGQTSQAILASQLVKLPSAWLLMKPLGQA